MTTTATTTHESGRAILDLARRVTLKMVADIPADELCTRPAGGGQHALWVLGHLAGTDDGFATILGKRASVLDDTWESLFGMNSEPSDDPSVYPSLDEVRAAMDRARQSLLSVYESLDEQQLLAPLPDELKPFAPNAGGVAFSVAWHEGFHAGQLSAVRRSLGLPRATG